MIDFSGGGPHRYLWGHCSQFFLPTAPLSQSQTFEVLFELIKGDLSRMPQVLHLNFKDAGTFTLLTAVLDCKRPTKIFEFATRPDALFHVQALRKTVKHNWFTHTHEGCMVEWFSHKFVRKGQFHKLSFGSLVTTQFLSITGHFPI